MGIVELKDVSRLYKFGNEEIYALKKVNLSLEPGLVVILGPSGSGKTTLLNIIGGLDKASSGSIQVNGEELSTMKKKRLIAYRRTDIGFIFQFFNLLPIYTALENVEYAIELAFMKKISHEEVHERAIKYLGLVGIGKEKIACFPSKLSGGEQQRVAAARAFAKEPKILLCDEPTGELSRVEGKQVLQTIQQVAHTKNTLVILVTHNQEIAKAGNIVIRLRSGEIEEMKQQTPVEVEKLAW